MKKRFISIICVIALSALMLAGCGSDDPLAKLSKDELIEQYHLLEDQLDALGTEYDEYKQLTAGIQSETEVTSAISVTGDGTGRYTFNSVDSKIIFPVTFQYPNSTVLTGDSTIQIGSGITIKPTANWICKLNGTTLELENPDAGISGTIKVGRQTLLLNVTELKDNVLKAWFAALPPAQVNYSPIDVKGSQYGMQATTPTTIESEDAFLRCGMIGEPSGFCVTYVFVYRGQSDASKNESVQNLLNTMVVGGNEITVTIN